jgi:hypothetical protein
MTDTTTTTNRARIIAALPGTARYIAARSGVKLEYVRVVLSREKAAGLVEPTGTAPVENPGRGPKTEIVWGLRPAVTGANVDTLPGA